MQGLEALAASRDRGEADRARAVLLTLRGWTSRRIAEAFAVREDTVRMWRSDFMRGGLEALKALVSGPVLARALLRLASICRGELTRHPTVWDDHLRAADHRTRRPCCRRAGADSVTSPSMIAASDALRRRAAEASCRRSIWTRTASCRRSTLAIRPSMDSK
jgi:hypothetical protein